MNIRSAWADDRLRATPPDGAKTARSELKRLLRNLRARPTLICAFLAILEMIRLQAVVCRQDDVFGQVVLKKSIGFDRLVDEGGAAVRDDWQ